MPMPGLVALALLQRDPPQTESVSEHRQRAEGHRGAGPDRRYEHTRHGIKHAGSDGHADDVVDESKKQILADVAQRGATQTARPQDPAQVPLDERDSRALDRDVRSS